MTISFSYWEELGVVGLEWDWICYVLRVGIMV